MFYRYHFPFPFMLTLSTEVSKGHQLPISCSANRCPEWQEASVTWPNKPALLFALHCSHQISSDRELRLIIGDMHGHVNLYARKQETTPTWQLRSRCILKPMSQFHILPRDDSPKLFIIYI